MERGENRTHREISRRNFIEAAVLVGSAFVSAACGNSTVFNKRSSPKAFTTTTTEVPTTTTQPEHLIIPSGKFLGAGVLIRISDKIAGLDKVAHRLNSAIWTGKEGASSTNADSMLHYGFTLQQEFGNPGEKGTTTVIASHDVTLVDEPVTIENHVYATPQMMQSPLANPSKNIGNFAVATSDHPGDSFVIYMNNPDSTMNEYTYEFISREIVRATAAELIKAVHPPANPEDNELCIYDCWPPHDIIDREVGRARLISTRHITDSFIPAPTSPEPPVNEPAL